MIYSFYEILRGVGLCSPCHKNHCSQIFLQGLQLPCPLVFPHRIFKSKKRTCVGRVCREDVFHPCAGVK